MNTLTARDLALSRADTRRNVRTAAAIRRLALIQRAAAAGYQAQVDQIDAEHATTVAQILSRAENHTTPDGT